MVNKQTANGGVDVDAIVEQKNKREAEENQPKIDFLKAEEKRNGDWKSLEIDKLAFALSKVQEEYEGVAKNQTNSFYGRDGKPSYADLHAVIRFYLKMDYQYHKATRLFKEQL